MLADTTGQTPNVASFSPEPTFIYVYAWPIDAVAARWLPWNGLPPSALAIAGGPPIPGNIQPPNPAVPLMPNLNVPSIPLYPLSKPARFLLSSSDQYPLQVGALQWNAMPQLYEGQGFVSRRIILTNVQQAQFVYTYLASDPNIWDALFTQAMVAVLASQAVGVIHKDKTEQEKIALRNEQILIAKNAIREARVASDNEAGFRQSTDHIPDWLRARNFGRGMWGGLGWGVGEGGGPGYDFCSWGAMPFADGSVF